MTISSNDHSLSRLELVVLARMSCPKAPTERVLVQDVASMALPSASSDLAREAVLRALGALRDRGWVAKPRRSLTEKGESQLRKSFELAVTPKWDKVRDEHLAALELGLRPGSDEARRVVASAESFALAVLRAGSASPKAASLTVLCDALITEVLGLPPGPVTLAGIRASVLARHFKLENKGSIQQIAARAAAVTLGEPRGTKRAFGRALARRWAYETTHREPSAPTNSPRSTAVQAALPWSPPPALMPAIRIPDSTPPAPAPSADTLLTLVREAIPRIGSDGRFGAEKVFVSAIWRRIERDSRVPNLSLDRFKRWLVSANRDQLVDLARADLVGAMDPKLVAESEIEDLGATFHFVVDRRANASARGMHAR